MIDSNTNNEKELILEGAETEKEFYLGVNYYSGKVPYVILYESRDSAEGDEIFKVRVPYKPKKETL